jgi:hypothetical protein
MLQSYRQAAVLAMMGIVLIALFPCGIGPFTATHGPMTAVKAVVDPAVEFTAVSVLPVTPVTYLELHVLLESRVGPVATFDATPIPSLRC